MSELTPEKRQGIIDLAKQIGLDPERFIEIIELMERHSKGRINSEVVAEFAGVPVKDEWTLALLAAYVRDMGVGRGLDGAELLAYVACDCFMIGAVVGYHLAKNVS